MWKWIIFVRLRVHKPVWAGSCSTNSLFRLVVLVQSNPWVSVDLGLGGIQNSSPFYLRSKNLLFVEWMDDWVTEWTAVEVPNSELCYTLLAVLLLQISLDCDEVEIMLQVYRFLKESTSLFQSLYSTLILCCLLMKQSVTFFTSLEDILGCFIRQEMMRIVWCCTRHL